MKRKARWIVVVSVVGALAAFSLASGSAAEPDSLRRLALENRVAEVIADLNLTAEQKAQLKEVAEKYREARTATSTELARLLAERRDALLAGDREAVGKVDEELKALMRQNTVASDEGVREFLNGLTERQKQVLARILPGINASESRGSTRIGPGRVVIRMPLPQRVTRSYGGYGFNSEVIDILIDLLGR